MKDHEKIWNDFLNYIKSEITCCKKKDFYKKVLTWVKTNLYKFKKEEMEKWDIFTFFEIDPSQYYFTENDFDFWSGIDTLNRIHPSNHGNLLMVITMTANNGWIFPTVLYFSS